MDKLCELRDELISNNLVDLDRDLEAMIRAKVIDKIEDAGVIAFKYLEDSGVITGGGAGEAATVKAPTRKADYLDQLHQDNTDTICMYEEFMKKRKHTKAKS